TKGIPQGLWQVRMLLLVLGPLHHYAPYLRAAVTTSVAVIMPGPVWAHTREEDARMFTHILGELLLKYRAAPVRHQGLIEAAGNGQQKAMTVMPHHMTEEVPANLVVVVVMMAVLELIVGLAMATMVELGMRSLVVMVV
ncbi:hypothetical protein Vafri_3658, partial [Volvox africanus]